MIASTQITNNEILAVLLFKSVIEPYSFVYKKNSKLNGKTTAELYVVEMRNFVNNFKHVSSHLSVLS